MSLWQHETGGRKAPFRKEEIASGRNHATRITLEGEGHLGKKGNPHPLGLHPLISRGKKAKGEK